MHQQEFLEQASTHGLEVSDNTYPRLCLYAEKLIQHNLHANLIAKNSIKDLWQRHFFDCLQLSLYIKDKNAIIADFGCGAGLPGLVLAILGYQNIYLVEANHRKTMFLQLAQQALNIKTNIINKRIEDWHLSPSCPPLDFITARAVAPLDSLVKLTKPYFNKNCQALFLKGKNHQQEWLKAQKLNLCHEFDKINYPSITQQTSTIISLKLKNSQQEK